MITFTVAIPTYNRENDLSAALESIVSQSAMPEELMLVDDGALPADYVGAWRARFEARRVVFTYYKKDHAVERRGISESKNIILKAAKGDVVFIFDDDVVLEDGFLKEFMRVWNGNPDEKLIGVGGVARNSRKKSVFEKIYFRFFGLSSSLAWDVNPVVYVVWDEGITETVKGYYMHGFASSFRRKEAEKLEFAPFSGGRGALEDLDFCLRAKRAGYYFLTVPAPKVAHNQSPTSREAEFMIGFKESMNRREIFRRDGLRTPIGKLWFCWATFGWVLRHALVLRFQAVAGKIYGLFKSSPGA